MNEELRQRIIERLKRGEELPREWAQDLFPPEKMEYELVYHGKEREGDVIANTMAVPLQEVRTFGKNGKVGWHNMLILGDNLQVLKRLLEYKKEGRLSNADGTHGVKLIYIDPPFATMQEFHGSDAQKAYRDKITGASFLEFLRKRLVLLRELLADNGTLYLHLDYRKIHYLKALGDEVFGENNFMNEVIWCYRERGISRTYWNNKHQTILVWAKSLGNQTFNFDDARIPYSDNYLKKFKYQDEQGKYQIRGKNIKGSPVQRADGLTPDTEKKYPDLTYRQYIQDGQLPLDWWEMPLLNKAATERIGYPTQKPEALLEKIISASSNHGDIVLDCFAGSGTTIAVAEKLGRRWIGIDRGKLAIYTVQRRMMNLKSEIGDKGKSLTPKAFTLYNAGLYDFASLKQMPRDDWRFFALQLFECKDEKHKIGGLELDGKRRSSSVLVFNHHENPDTKIDEDAIRSIHRRIGDKIGRSFYIIAPRHTFAFQQDYITLDDTKYFALRIPYSFINELHRREFSALQQPKDETAVNDLINAEGFDFIQPPIIKYKVGVKKRPGQLLQEAFVKLNDFESKARVRGGLESRGMDAFSMLLLDLDYDGEVFQLHTHLYAKDMEAADWHAWFPVESIGKNIMAVFIDIYGNESSHVITRDELKLPKKKKG